jgi:hypothetical protein
LATLSPRALAIRRAYPAFGAVLVAGADLTSTPEAVQTVFATHRQANIEAVLAQGANLVRVASVVIVEAAAHPGVHETPLRVIFAVTSERVDANLSVATL